MPEENGVASNGGGGGGGGGGGNNSSDFVRKLFNMLKDPENQEIVRWSDDGLSFIVLEGGRFNKEILPKHFKHNNFSSFVRQLNKYDFHKVRRTEENNEDQQPRADSWEFRHERFTRDGKNNLDDIRRKAPAARKPQAVDETIASMANQVGLLAEALNATQQQIQALQMQFQALTDNFKSTANECMLLHRINYHQRTVLSDVVVFLENRCKASPGINANQEQAEIRRIYDVLNSNPVETEKRHSIFTPSTTDQLATLYNDNHNMMPMIQDDALDMGRYGVYPVGETNGIDPFSADHMKNIPYQFQSDTAVPAAAAAAAAPTPTISTNAQITANNLQQQQQLESTESSPMADEEDPDWGNHQPRIFLIEDDKICSRIGSKFLTSLGCTVETAHDGLHAVDYINKRNQDFDLIFMDIIMPRMDGVSATACIREHMPTIPIIAMTANIKAEDIEYYYSHGMSDVLAKPFTRYGMRAMLRKHLSSFLKTKNTPDNNLISVSMSASMSANMTASPSNGMNNGMNSSNLSANALTPQNGMTPATPGMNMGNGNMNGEMSNSMNAALTPTNMMQSQQNLPTLQQVRQQVQHQVQAHQSQKQAQNQAAQQAQNQLPQVTNQFNMANIKYEHPSTPTNGQWNSSRPPLNSHASPSTNNNMDPNSINAMMLQQRMIAMQTGNMPNGNMHNNGNRMATDMITDRPDKRQRIFGPDGGHPGF